MAVYENNETVSTLLKNYLAMAIKSRNDAMNDYNRQMKVAIEFKNSVQKWNKAIDDVKKVCD